MRTINNNTQRRADAVWTIMPSPDTQWHPGTMVHSGTWWGPNTSSSAHWDLGLNQPGSCRDKHWTGARQRVIIEILTAQITAAVSIQLYNSVWCKKKFPWMLNIIIAIVCWQCWSWICKFSPQHENECIHDTPPFTRYAQRLYLEHTIN